MGLHLACIVRPGDTNEELRFAMRSWQRNLDVESLTIVGHCPRWVDPDHFVRGNRYTSKQRNVFDNVRLAAMHDQAPAEQVVMNDDFFVMRPGPIEMTYRGKLIEHIDSIGGSWWQQSLILTYKWLEERGHADPLSYELHRPFPINSARMAEVLTEARDCSRSNPPQWRTLYGNRWQVGGTQDEDAKANHRGERPLRMTTRHYLSTTDLAFQRTPVGEYVRACFPEPSRWER